MKVESCRVCKKLFKILEGEHVKIICPACLENPEAIARVLNQYMKKSPKATLNMIYKNTGIPIIEIQSLAREGKISLTLEEINAQIANNQYTANALSGMKGPETQKTNLVRMHVRHK
ncbi:hypothetical protein AN639_05970 [Candidatus Epulonipiscium fishelsonii]|uniref:Uncharacterized protein n=1 Tax=Candidatus Epulonipiscium fishelsonii TaxID=77094 RepID=A0ACC8XBX5_9FIRM|nr:hypothetical protein AN639_05970 [Epulopiscium sp. SCG-B05WGA-EpuloA1]ONI40042.1 hypothetical protein AN396_06750 [Epulopiscium sp. SCG-B11WGA-EpuloA1]